MLTVEFEIVDLADKDIDIEEDRGRVLYRIGSHLTPQQIAEGLTAGARAVLKGGHWFQEWKGDIISMDRDPGEPPASDHREDD